MGKKTSSTTNTNSPPQYIQDAQKNAITQATGLSQNPFQAYQGPYVAGFTPAQSQAFSSINGLQGGINPYINSGAALTGQAANSIANQIPLMSNPATAGLANSAYQTFTNGPQDILGGSQAALPGMTNSVNNATQGYFNPYMNTAIQGAMGWMNNQNQQQQNQLVGNAVSAGAWGGDRAAVAQGVLGGQQSLAMNNTISQMENQGYGQAQQTALGTLGQAQQGVTAQNQAALGFGSGAQQAYSAQLAAAQQAASQQGLLNLYAGQQMGSLGALGQQTNLQDINAQLAIGQQQQTQAQNQLNVPYQLFQQQQQWPYQQLNYLDQIINGTAGLGGGTTVTQQPAGSLAGQLTGAGIGLAGSGAFGNSGWLTGNNGLFNSIGSWLSGSKRGGAVGYDSGGSVMPPPQSNGMSAIDYLMLRNKQHLFSDPLFEQQQQQQPIPAFPSGGAVEQIHSDPAGGAINASNILAEPGPAYSPIIPTMNGPSPVSLGVSPLSNYSPFPQSGGSGVPGGGTPGGGTHVPTPTGGGGISIGTGGGPTGAVGSPGGVPVGFTGPGSIAPASAPTLGGSNGAVVPSSSGTLPNMNTSGGSFDPATNTFTATQPFDASLSPSVLATMNDLANNQSASDMTGTSGMTSPSGAINAALTGLGMLPGIAGNVAGLAGAGLGFYNGSQGLTSQPLNSTNSTQGAIANWAQNPGWLQQAGNWLGNALFGSPQMGLDMGAAGMGQSMDSGMNMGSVSNGGLTANPGDFGSLGGLDFGNIGLAPSGASVARGGRIRGFDGGGATTNADDLSASLGYDPYQAVGHSIGAPGLGVDMNGFTSAYPSGMLGTESYGSPYGIKVDVNAPQGHGAGNAGHASLAPRAGASIGSPTQDTGAESPSDVLSGIASAGPGMGMGVPPLASSADQAPADGSGDTGGSNDWWGNLATNPKLAMMAFGLGMMGSKGNFGQAIGEGGEKALSVAVGQHKELAEEKYRQQEVEHQTALLNADIKRWDAMAGDRAGPWRVEKGDNNTFYKYNTLNGDMAPVGGSTGGISPLDYAGRVSSAIENPGGKPDAKNPNSTAAGNGQFIDKTWLQVARATHPELAGVPDAKVLALRDQPGYAQQAIADYGKMNADFLTRNNEPVNSATLALAHHFGPDGAQKLLSAPQNTPLDKIFGADVMRANPDLKGKTAGQYVTMIATKVGTDPVDFGGNAASLISPPQASESSTGVDPALSGEAFMRAYKQKDPADAAWVKAIVEGRAPQPSSFFLKSPKGQRLMDAASQYDPEFDLTKFARRQKTANDMTPGGKTGQAVISFNTAIGHAGNLYDSIDALNNSNFPYWNQISNYASTQAGDVRYQKAVKQFTTYKHALSDELTRAFRMSSGNVHDVKNWEETFDEADSPASLKTAVQSAMTLLKSRIEYIADQYGGGLDFQTMQPESLLASGARKTYDRILGQPETQIPSETDIAYTAKKYDMTPFQVRQKLGIGYAPAN